MMENSGLRGALVQVVLPFGDQRPQLCTVDVPLLLRALDGGVDLQRCHVSGLQGAQQLHVMRVARSRAAALQHAGVVQEILQLLARQVAVGAGLGVRMEVADAPFNMPPGLQQHQAVRGRPAFQRLLRLDRQLGLGRRTG